MTNTPSPDTEEQRKELLQALEESHERVKALMNKVDTMAEVYTGWTPRHFLAHLTGWDEAVTTSLRAHMNGKEPGTPAYRGILFYNEQSVAEREALTYPQIYAEWVMARDQLKAIIRELPADKFEQALIFPWGATGKVQTLVAIFFHHENEHAAEIENLLAEGKVPSKVKPE